MEGIRDIWVVARAEASRTLRSARAIVLFALFALFTLLVLLIAGGAYDESLAMIAAADAEQREGLLRMRNQTLGSLFEYDPALLESFLTVPGAILVVFKGALFFLPAYIALLGFDQLSVDLGTRSIRYLAVRASRSSILFGKFIAQALVLAALLFGVFVALFAYAAIVNEWLGPGMAVVTLLRFWVASLLYSVVWVALTSLCSALFRASALSLVLNFFLMFFFLALTAISFFGTVRAALTSGLKGAPTVTDWYGYLGYASPWHYATNLLHPHLGPFAVSSAALAGFAAVFLIAGYAVLRARDI